MFTILYCTNAFKGGTYYGLYENAVIILMIPLLWAILVLEDTFISNIQMKLLVMVISGFILYYEARLWIQSLPYNTYFYFRIDNNEIIAFFIIGLTALCGTIIKNRFLQPDSTTNYISTDERRYKILASVLIISIVIISVVVMFAKQYFQYSKYIGKKRHTTTESTQTIPTNESDSTTNAEKSVSSSEEINIDEVLESFYYVLEEYAAEDSEDKVFALANIDEDDIPELVLIRGDYHASGGIVYKFLNGDCMEVGEYGSNGTFQYFEKENIICSEYAGQGNFSNIYCSINDNGESENLISFLHMEYDPETEEESFTIDDEYVSENTYYSRMNSFTNGREPKTIDYYSGYIVTWDSIEDMLNDYQSYYVE